MGSEFCCCRLIVVPVVAPSDVGGGGGASRDLTITWTVSRDFPLGKVGRKVTSFWTRSQKVAELVVQLVVITMT